MKKILLILIALPMIGFSQIYTHRMDSTLIYNSSNQLIIKKYNIFDVNNNVII
ncbi:MAG: hypothetical protein P8P67_01780 [Flavobacteriales bacterium]|nr:hypothetical protein [Flavobacteriales bacterium]